MADGLTPRERFARLERTGESGLVVEGVPVEFNWRFDGQPNGERLLILKHPEFIDDYLSVIGDRSFRNILELGIFDGGSCFLFAHLFGAERLEALDLSEGAPTFERFRASHAIGQRIGAHFGTRQDDETALNSILDGFKGPPHLIIDDASHWLTETTRSFELLFPKLAPGGWYVLEDWSWAHFPVQLGWTDKDSLAHLLFRLMIAWIGRPDLIADIVVKRPMAFIRKHPDAPVGGRLSLDEICPMRGRVLQPF